MSYAQPDAVPVVHAHAHVPAVTAVPDPVPAADRHAQGWTDALQRILAEPHCVRVHYQPIVDLQRGAVRGYEALARFPEAAGVGPRDWFDAAAQLGYAGALEAQVMQAALVTRPLLTRDRFIAVNVSPAALLSAEVQAVLAAEHSLERLVIEVVDQPDGADLDDVAAALTRLRARGALVAVDDAGAGARSLERVTALRPNFVKVDGSLITGIDADDTRLEIVRTLGQFAARLDAWIVAEGIETAEQLDVLVQLGVPLGQGYALGRPSAAMGELDRTIAQRMRTRTPNPAAAERLSGLMDRAPAVPVAGGPGAVTEAFASHPAADHVVVLTPNGHPCGVIDSPAHQRGTLPRAPLSLTGGVPIADAARRAMARPLATRFDPVAVIGEDDAYVGLVPIDRIVGALAR
ncbi:hypothetical protein DSM112329_04348 [Paraconexibacter sp. AEG42_29]|uniref:EAL domain-containing protein n=1 Tax=Paraconexibacter sp. AEG42_29 TaxID=2997339 RepID=A0AAU7B0F1_9ACTN